MKTTASLMDIIQTELINNGLNEFVNKVDGVTQITKNDDKFTFIRKVAQYDDDVQAVVNHAIFMNFSLENKQADLFFKKSFINRFVDREIGTQTLELFTNHLIGQYITDEHFITNLFLNMDKYFINNSDSSGNTTSVTDNNSDTSNLDGYNRANVDLPQDEVSLDLHKDTIDYANQNDINRGFSNQKYNNHNNVTTTNSSQTASYNADVLDKLNVQWDNLFNKYDRKLFLQIW